MKPVRNASCLWLLAAALLFATAGCGGNGSDVPGEASAVSRQGVLTSLSGLVIVPRYGQSADSIGQLADLVGALCSAPEATVLEAARSGWRRARDAWTTTEAYRFGPAVERRSVSLVGWWPVAAERIDPTVAEGKPVTVETVWQFMPSTQRGIGAMERLLFGEGSEGLSGSGSSVGADTWRPWPR